MTQPSTARIGISSLSLSPYDWIALDFVLAAVKTRTPKILEAIRDAPGDNHEGLVKSWATQHYLQAPLMVEYMVHQREWWTKYQRHAKALEFGGQLRMVGIVPPDGDREWVKEHTHYSSLPDPIRETVQEWLDRAREMYDSRDRLGPIKSKTKRKPRPRWKDFARHCDWLVQIQVQGRRPSEIAVEERVDRAAVERGSRAIANLLGLQRREWRRGRRRVIKRDSSS